MADEIKGWAGDYAVYCAHDEVVETGKLVPNPRNPYNHPDQQIALLAKIIAGQGWRAPITVSKRSGFIVRGHARLKAAELLGNLAPVDYQYYENEAAEYADLIADNRIAELAEFDRPRAKDLLEELDAGALDMDLTGFDSGALEELMTQVHNPDVEHKRLAERFIVPPFTILDARQGYWQDRKRAWLSLGMQSELGRGANLLKFSEQATIGVGGKPAPPKAIMGGGRAETKG